MKKNIFITGTNRGIGLALVKLYLKEGNSVWAICRNASEELKNSGANIIEGINLLDEDFEGPLATQVKDISIDVLINNAGILENNRLEDMDPNSLMRQFRVNAIAPLRVTKCLLNQLSAGAKIAMITSRMGSIADNTSGGSYGYRMSKAALNIASVSLAHDLKSRNISVAILHPGYVKTDMVGNRGDITAQEAAARLKLRIDELIINNSGTFWHSKGEKLPW